VLRGVTSVVLGVERWPVTDGLVAPAPSEPGDAVAAPAGVVVLSVAPLVEAPDPVGQPSTTAKVPAAARAPPATHAVARRTVLRP